MTCEGKRCSVHVTLFFSASFSADNADERSIVVNKIETIHVPILTSSEEIFLIAKTRTQKVICSIPLCHFNIRFNRIRVDCLSSATKHD